MRQRALVEPHQVGEQLARPIETGEHRREAILHLLEQHRARSAFELRGDAGKIVAQIDFGLDAREAAVRFQVGDDGAEIGDMAFCHDPPLFRPVLP